MEIFSFENFIKSDLQQLKQALESTDEELTLSEISKILPKLLQEYYTHSNSESRRGPLQSFHREFIRVFRLPGKIRHKTSDFKRK